MSWYKDLSRREFIRLGAVAAAATGVISCSSPQIPWRFFTVGEARTLAALCDQIIPPDSDPGAQWASVVNYIDIQLCGPYADLQVVYRKELVQMDITSTKHFGHDFASLPMDSQLALLKSIEQGTASTDPAISGAGRSFFQLVVEHTMQGFYGDPRHGGNRDRTSWKMLELPYPPVRGQQRYGGSKG
jgi:gluconate 2-dehydrogenase gamma chain